MPTIDWKDFKGAAKRISDIDIPRVADKIKVGEDELHAFMDVETSGSGFDAKGRPKILFEPHVFYRNLSGQKRAAAVTAGLAYPKWGEKPYPSDSYPRLIKAMAIDETAALKSASWGLGQTLGENHEMVGYHTAQDMVQAFMADEATHLEAIVDFIISAKIDDEMRDLAALTRKTTAADCEKIVSVYNGPGYKKNRYHVKMAAAHNKWRAIKDTPWSPNVAQPVAFEIVNPTVRQNTSSSTGATYAQPITAPEGTADKELIERVQDLLWDKGYPEVGESDGKFGRRTRNTIISFQADNDLPLTGTVTDDLLAQLVKAPKREVSDTRKTATAKDLKAEPIVQVGTTIKTVGTGILAASGLGGIMDGSAKISDITDGIGQVQSLVSTVMPVLPWIAGALAGWVVLHFGRRVISKYVEAYREGRTL